MKKFFLQCLLIGGCLFFVPLIIIYGSGYKNEELLAFVNENIQKEVEGDKQNTLLDESMLIPLLAKEIPYTYEYETIKAQAVIIRTYVTRKALGIQTNGTILGYTDEEMRSLWKENYDSIYATYKEALQDTVDQVLLYDGTPIQALYHGASGGMTRSAQAVYGVDVPYLVSVTSSVDNVNKQIKLTKESIIEKLQKENESFVADSETLENQIQIVEKDEAGYIKSIQIGNIVLGGEKLKSLFDLPSSNFKIFTSGDYLIFDVKGNGIGVGLSQNGANELAKQGKTYDEILKYYYTGVEIAPYEKE